MLTTIFFSFAHPDDEAFTVGGLLADYADRSNVTTIVYSATLGDAGKCGNPPVCKKEELASFRKKELESACSILGVDHLIMDAYDDGKLNQLPINDLVDRVSKHLQQYKPEIVVTFPPDGISGHPDHIAISKATLKAASQLPFVKKLYYIALPSIHKTYDVAKPIKQKHLEKVRNALLAHKSQHLSVDRVFPTIHEKEFQKHNNVEYFSSIIGTNDKGNDLY